MDTKKDAQDGTPTDDGDDLTQNSNTRTLAIAAFLLADTVVMGSVAVFVLHRHFADQDEQKANLVSLAVGSVATLVSLAILWFIANRVGRRREWLAVVGGGFLLAIALVRFDGFNGEMAPQLRWRFGKQPPPMSTFVDKPESAGVAQKSSPSGESAEHNSAGDSGAARDGNELTSKRSGADSVSLASFRQFLGPNQNGVIAQREFKIPTAADQVRTRWRIGIGEGWSSFAVANGLAITLEQRGPAECVSAYRLVDGEPVWIHRVEARHENALGGIGPRSTPLITNDRVYTHGATGVVCCLDLVSGELIWQTELLSLGGWDQADSESILPWGRSASPMLAESGDSRLIVLPLGGPDDVADDGRALVALDAASGEMVWRTGREQISFASPVLMTIDGVEQIVSVNEDTVTGHVIETGDRLWAFDWPGRSSTGPSCASAIAVGDDQFLVGKGYGGGSSLAKVFRSPGGDDWQAEEVWHSNTLLKTKFNHTVVDGTVGFGIGNGSIEAVDLTKPKRLWRGKRDGRVGQGQLLLAGDVIIAQAETGEVRFIAADPDQYDEQFVLPALSSKTWNIPTLAGTFLLVRNDREAICFELPAKATN